MHSSLKYLIATSTVLFSLSQSQAEMVQSSSFIHESENSGLAARVLNKDAQNFNFIFLILIAFQSPNVLPTKFVVKLLLQKLKFQQKSLL